MKVGFYMKCLEERKEDKETFEQIVKDHFEKERRKLIKRSIRVLKWKMQSGYHGDDFIHNMFTIIFTGKGYKIPRMIKNMLLK